MSRLTMGQEYEAKALGFDEKVVVGEQEGKKYSIYKTEVLIYELGVVWEIEVTCTYVGKST